MKLKDADFQLFQSSFRKYQTRFGLLDYKIYFRFERLDSCFADITITQHDMVVTVRLNNEVLKGDEVFKDVECSAKHEAIHLLLGKLEYEASARYTSAADIYEAVEALVHRLEELIVDENKER